MADKYDVRARMLINGNSWADLKDAIAAALRAVERETVEKCAEATLNIACGGYYDGDCHAESHIRALLKD